MLTAKSFTLSEQALLGLFYIQRYRFLTIDQFARAAVYKRSTASDQLGILEHRGLLGYFGNTGKVGYGKTPKVYFLTRKGWEILTRESDIPPEMIGNYKEVRVESRWSPQMYHRIHTVDMLISAELAVRARPPLTMVKTFLEFKRVKRGTQIMRETPDYVEKEETTENKIIPDAAFILENIETGNRALFFIEMDMATERIISLITRDSRITLHHKFKQYDRYLKGQRYRQTYSDLGEFRYFMMLFVTLNENRVENIRREMQDLPADLAPYYRLTTYEKAREDFLGRIWKSRLHSDAELYQLVR
jgi:hypothetical protein